jgi:hypothetical protein
MVEEAMTYRRMPARSAEAARSTAAALSTVSLRSTVLPLREELQTFKGAQQWSHTDALATI